MNKKFKRGIGIAEKAMKQEGIAGVVIFKPQILILTCLKMTKHVTKIHAGVSK